MPRTVHVAYDASINAEWVTRYAIRLASRTPERVLRLITVDDGTPRPPDFTERLANIERACRDVGTELHPSFLPMQGSVVQTLTTVVPQGRDSLLVCGTRARDAGRGLLGGTVSARLLHGHHCGVLAIRVVSPGLLGAPKRILYALSQNPKSVSRALPFLELLTVDIEELSLLTVMEVGAVGFGRETTAAHAQLLQRGRGYLHHCVEELRAGLGVLPRIEHQVLVSDDVPDRIARHAARMRAQLVLVGATGRSLPRRVVSPSPLERVLEATPCDVAIFREAAGG